MVFLSNNVSDTSNAIKHSLLITTADLLHNKYSVNMGRSICWLRLVVQGSQLFLQFITRYLHYSGQMRCRVTTLTRFWTDGSNSADLINGFDQEAAAALMARLATYKMETEDDFDPTRFLDRSLIRLCQRWGLLADAIGGDVTIRLLASNKLSEGGGHTAQVQNDMDASLASAVCQLLQSTNKLCLPCASQRPDLHRLALSAAMQTD